MRRYLARTRALGGMLMVVTLGGAACGGSDGDTAKPAGQTSPGSPSTVDASAEPEPSPVLPVTVTNADGSSVTVTDVSRIIPLNGDIAEVLFALDVGNNVVATDLSATYPPEADSLPEIGYQRTLNAEGILSFQPTLVIGNTEAGPPEVIQQVRGAGVPVVTIDIEPSIDAPAEKIEAIAAAVGVPGRGSKLAATTSTAIADATRLAEKAKDSPRVVFLYLRGPTTQLIAGKGTGVDVMLRAAGATDAAGESAIQGTVPITAEALVAAAPDVIVVTSTGLRSVGGIDGLLQIPGIAQTPAGKERRILDYDDQKLLGGGPRTGEALRQLVTDLHPRLG
jgi:iron complex transport system substrate-binding protein